MSLRERLLAHLTSHKGISYCARCVAEASGSNEKFVHQYMRYLSWRQHNEFSTRHEPCHSCGNLRLVVCALEGTAALEESYGQLAPAIEVGIKTSMLSRPDTTRLGHELDAHIEQLKKARARLNSVIPASTEDAGNNPSLLQKRSRISAEAREKISRANKKRWAERKMENPPA